MSMSATTIRKAFRHITRQQSARKLSLQQQLGIGNFSQHRPPHFVPLKWHGDSFRRPVVPRALKQAKRSQILGSVPLSLIAPSAPPGCLLMQTKMPIAYDQTKIWNIDTKPAELTVRARFQVDFF